VIYVTNPGRQTCPAHVPGVAFPRYQPAVQPTVAFDLDGLQLQGNAVRSSSPAAYAERRPDRGRAVQPAAVGQQVLPVDLRVDEREDPFGAVGRESLGGVRRRPPRGLRGDVAPGRGAPGPVASLRMRAEVLKGHLDALLLATLEGGPRHGYAVIEALRSASGGRLDLPTGTIYPALHRLERAGLVSGSWTAEGGRRRRTYELTAAGRRALVAERSSWEEFSGLVSAVLRGRRWAPA
jgi:PadR family transcriptional regulator PadR